MADVKIQKWGSYTPEAAAEDQKAAASGGSFLTFKEGDNNVRILPQLQGSKSPFKMVNQHFLEIDGEKVIFACPRYEAHQPCPACAEGDKLRKTGNKQDYELAKSYFAKKRFFANVIDRDEPEKGVQVMGFGSAIMDPLTKIAQNPRTGGDFSDPINGFDVVINREGTSKNDTTYTVFGARQSSRLAETDEEIDALLDSMHDLSQQSPVKNLDEIMEMMGLEGGGRAPRGTIDVSPQQKQLSGKPPRTPVPMREPAPMRAPAPRSRTAQDDVMEGVETGNDDDQIPF